MSKIDELIAELCPEGVEHKKLGEVIRKVTGANKKIAKKDIIEQGKYPVYTQGVSKKPDGYSNNADEVISDTPVILYGDHTNVLKWIEDDFIAGADGVKLVSTDINSGLNDRYLYYVLQDRVREIADGYARHFSKLRQISIPIPPLEVQRAIVGVLDSFTELEAELEARKKQYEFYRNQLLILKNIEGVEYKKIKDVYKRLRGTPITAGKMREIQVPNGEVRVFAGGKTVIDANEQDIPKANITKVPAVLVQSRGVIDAIFYDKPFTFKNEMWAYTSDNMTSVKFLYYMLKNNIDYFRDAASGMGSLPQISLRVTENFTMPIPPAKEQRCIVSILDKFDKLTTDISVGLPAEINARRKQYEYYRSKLLTFDEKKEPAHV